MRTYPWIRIGGLAGLVVSSALVASCSGGPPASSGAGAGVTSTGPGMGTGAGTGGGATLPPAASCTPAAKGSATVQMPTLLYKLADRYQEGWLSSPAVADLDGDGKNEIIVAREGIVVVWNADGTPRWRYDTMQDRIWASPVIADLAGDAKLEVAVAARDQIFVLDAEGNLVSGFPVTWNGEMRSLAAADVDGDGKLELVTAPGMSNPPDMMNVWKGDGSVLKGFPPNTSGTSGCQVDNKCYLAGAYDQNVALGDLDGDGHADLVVGQDDAYFSIQKSTGEAFDANPEFSAKKTPGVRYLFDLAEAEQGYANDESTALQAHFTNSAPAIADLDGDGVPEVVILGSVQNAAQTSLQLGVGLWAVHHDGSRLKGWETPFHAPDYLAGLVDYDGVNIVAATNQVTVADIDAAHPGPEMIFAGFDGRIHAVSAAAQELWAYTYTTDPDVLTGGVVVADLSGDGVPEIVFNTYSKDTDKSSIFILDAKGNKLFTIPLPGHGAMTVPTIADVNGDGTLEIVVSLKDATDKVESAEVWTVPGSSANCLLWPTGRGNLLRDGWVRAAK